MPIIHPSSSSLSKGTVEKIAEKIAAELSYQPGADLFKFVKQLGGRVCIVDFWSTSEEHGALTVKAYNDFVINIPDHTSPRRDNFTIAHELGHYFLHYFKVVDQLSPDDVFVAKRLGSERVEWEANWFASAFLMPEDIFRNKFRDIEGDLFELSDYFNVSKKAAEIRSIRLGLLE